MGTTEEVLSLPLTGSSGADSNSNQNREQQCLQAARQIFSCYRRDDAADPDGYVASVAAVLSEYPPDIVDLVSDPRTGIGRRSKFLPNTADISEDCDKITNRLAADRVNAEFQKRRAATPKYIPVVIWAPNLFVPAEVMDYDKMVERAKTENPERYRYEKAHLCVDNVKRDGLWVPVSWWEDRGGKTKKMGTVLADISRKVLERAGIDPSGPSPALLKTLQEQKEDI